MDYLEVLEHTGLFADMSREDIACVLECVGTRRAEYEKGQTVLGHGSVSAEIGIVLSGSAQSIIETELGKTLIVALIERGGYIGLLLSSGHRRASPVTVRALDRLTVLFIPFEGILKRCAKGCPRHDVLLRNCFVCLSEKGLGLYDRINCLMRPSVREKVMAYLMRLAVENDSNVFMIPLDRKAMAEYINVDRSALSRELSRMKNDGLIDYYKNSFKVL